MRFAIRLGAQYRTSETWEDEILLSEYIRNGRSVVDDAKK